MKLGIILNFSTRLFENKTSNCLLHLLNYNKIIKPSIEDIENFLSKNEYNNTELWLYILSDAVDLDEKYLETILRCHPCNIVVNSVKNLYNYPLIIALAKNIYLIDKTDILTNDYLFLIGWREAFGNNVIAKLLSDIHINLKFLALPKKVAQDNKFTKFAVSYYIVNKQIDNWRGKTYCSLINYYNDKEQLLEKPNLTHYECWTNKIN